MLIIDSLLKFNLFSLWRGAGEPLSFLGQSSTSRNGIASHVDCATQLRSVVIGAEHGKQSMQQLSHNRYDGLQPSFAAKSSTRISLAKERSAPKGPAFYCLYIVTLTTYTLYESAC
jgi:hypothetical protein